MSSCQSPSSLTHIIMNPKRKLLLTLLIHKKRLLLLHRIKTTHKIKRKYWIHPINKVRATLGLNSHLIKELRQDEDRFFRYFRMAVGNFDYLLNMIKDRITKMDTRLRKAIKPDLKLAVTLHYLAEGSSIQTAATHYRVGKSTAYGMITETCQALYDCLQPLYMQPPSGPSEWLHIAEGFQRWNFPHCLGSIDGKHVMINKPSLGGSIYHNYKQRESLVLMAVVDAEYKFVMVDVGQPGSQSDGGIWESSAFGQALLLDKVNLPPPDSETDLPYVFIGDEAFPLKPYLMRPFPGRQLDGEEKRVYNYRLSRARRVVENAFGILAHRWRLLLRTINAGPRKVELMVKTMCVLHNFLRTTADPHYLPTGFTDYAASDGSIREGFWRTGPTLCVDLAATQSRHSTAHAKATRDRFVRYFNSEDGSVAWQLSYVRRR